MASDSSASTSPSVITPESTGTTLAFATNDLPDDTPNTATDSKKTRRQTAFYPNLHSGNKPQKPFSRSAAKRESVMALGSIEHLQHYFTKTGLAAKKSLIDKPHYGLVPAIGGKGHVPAIPSITSLSDIVLPPSPIIPNPPVHQPHVKSHEVDPDSLLPGVIDDVITAAHAWQLVRRQPTDGASSDVDLDISFDVLDVLKTTTRAIRSTRNYVLALPDESTGTIRAQYKHKPFKPTHVLVSTAPPPLNPTPHPPPAKEQDPIVLLRRAALDVLSALRQLEEDSRLPLSDDAYDAQSDGANSRGIGGGTASSPSQTAIDSELGPDDSHSNGAPDHSAHHHHFDADASITFSRIQVNGRYETVPVWEDEEDVFNLDAEEEQEKKEGWDERLVLSSGWLYKQDIKLSQLTKEREVVAAYLDLVDDVLFEAKPEEQTRGWDKARAKLEGRTSSRNKGRRVSSFGDGENRLKVAAEPRRVSTGMFNLMQGMSLNEEPEDMDDIREEDDEDVVPDEDLPEWARRSLFADDELGRAYAILSTFLSPHLKSSLASTSSRTEFLASLSSGQLLCMGYNACLRRSKKPWGFINTESVHDIIALEASQPSEEQDGKKVWTFRRTDNLRIWASALKLRYSVPIHLPNQILPKPPIGTPRGTPLSSPTKSKGFVLPSKADLSAITFDAKLVARKDPGWEDMLESALFAWMNKVVEERRQYH